MNSLVSSKYDRFERRTTISLNYLVEPQLIENTTNFSDVSLSVAAFQDENERPLFAIYIVGKNDEVLGKTRFLFRLNDSERLSFDGREVSQYSHTVLLSEDDFMRICKAETIEMRIEVGDGNMDYTTEELQIAARIIYNAVIDEGAYLEEVHKVEEEEAAKQRELEKQKEAIIKEWERLKSGTLNKHVERDYNEIEERITISLKEDVELDEIKTTLLIINTKLDFRYLNEKGKKPIFLIDITGVTTGGDTLDLQSGQLILNVGEKQLALLAHESFSKPYLESYHIESDYYEISRDILKDICETTSLTLRVTNGHQYADLSTDGVQIAARRFYNAIVDNTAYLDDMLTEKERKAAERERVRKEQEAESERLRVERDKKAAENARIEAERREKWWQENKQKVLVTLAIVVAIVLGCIFLKSLMDKRELASQLDYTVQEDSKRAPSNVVRHVEEKNMTSNSTSYVEVKPEPKAKEVFPSRGNTPYGTTVFDVVAGSFIKREDAVNFMIKMRNLGYSDVFQERTFVKGDYYYRIIVRSARSIEEARRVKKHLVDNGYKPWIWKHKIE